VPLIAALGDIVLAFCAALFLWCAYQLFHNFLVALVNRIPLVGHQLALLTDVILHDMEQAAYTWAKDTVKALVAVILAPIHWIESLINYIYGSIHALYSALSILRYITVPTLISSALSVAHGWVSDAETYAGQLFSRAQTYTLELYNRAISFTQAEVQQAEAYTATLYTDAITYTDHEIQLAEAYTSQLFTTATTYTAKGISDLEQWTAAGLGSLGASLTGDITALSKWITATLPAVYAYVDTSVGVVESDLARLKTDCTDNLCSGLGGLAGLLNALGGDLGLAGLLALAAEAARDPVGTGHLVEELFGSAARAGADVMRAAAGV